MTRRALFSDIITTLLLCLSLTWTALADPTPVRKGSCLLVGTSNHKDLSGRIYFEEMVGGEVRVKGEISGIQPASSEHGLHIHEWGHVGTWDGAGAGGHYNPHKKKHGMPPSHDRHVGDMGNIAVDDKGMATFTKTLNLLQLHGENSIIGRTVILHEKKDDGSDPVGNAGSRIGQCVIGVANVVGNTAAGTAETSAEDRQAICEMKSDDGKVYGRITFEQPAAKDTPVQIRARVCGMKPEQKHGFHIHEFGDLTGENSVTELVGGHYNPFNEKHGLPEKHGSERHMGDMGNIIVDGNGIAQYHEMGMDLIMLHGNNSIIGRAVIVHELEDNGNQPTGEAGNKIATCTIGIIDDYWEKQATPWDVICNGAIRLSWSLSIAISLVSVIMVL